MGIDYEIRSLTNPGMFEDPQNSYAKWAWEDIDWQKVLNFLHIDLARIYDHAIRYWAESQVEDMRDMIKGLAEGSMEFYDEEHRSTAESLKGEAEKLLVHFNYYVSQKARIYVS